MPLDVPNLSPPMSAEDEAVFAAARAATGILPANKENVRMEGVPKGEVSFFRLTGKRIYPEAARDCRVYVPEQYDPSQPADLILFQDGHYYLSDLLDATVVLDNLIAKGDLRPTVAVFLEAGDLIGHENADRANRSIEYDRLNDLYTQLIATEVLPEVTGSLSITDDPTRRVICGKSSGGIASFTVAWHRPDLFGCVISHCGSFTNLRGGGAYPTMIRSSQIRPIKVFLQSGNDDMDRVAGNWAVANYDMATALRLKGYDYRFEFGTGAHTLHHAAAIFPQTLRWIWRRTPQLTSIEK